MTYLLNYKTSPTYCIVLLVIFYQKLGTVSYLNYSQNLQEIKSIAQRHCYGPNLAETPYLVLSFRYAQIIDEQALEEMSYMIEQLKNSSVKLMFTGLHLQLLQKMKTARYFQEILQNEPNSFYSLHVQ